MRLTKAYKAVQNYFEILDRRRWMRYTEGVFELLLCAGVWLSLARAPGLGPGGRRFESCHPD